MSLKFHHIHVYAESLQPLSAYKRLESQLNTLAAKGSYDPFSGGMRFLEDSALPTRVQEGRKVWETQIASAAELRDPSAFAPAGQDIVEQLIVGLGWRVTAEYVGSATRSLLVTSSDALGVKFCVTCILPGSGDGEDEPYDHFRKAHVERFLAAHNNRFGIAVLGFEVVESGGVEGILQQYREKHPELLVRNLAPASGACPGSPTKRPRKELSFAYADTRQVSAAAAPDSSISTSIVLGQMRIGEVFAYYSGGGTTGGQKGGPDCGTVLRFVHREGTFGSRPGFANPEGVLPGFSDVNPQFDGTTIPAYSDHWVSNVHDREGFLQTLNDTLGFTPKVDFNAGVVAAGEARIESTVTGNTSTATSTTPKEALTNQSQARDVANRIARLRASRPRSIDLNRTELLSQRNILLRSMGRRVGGLLGWSAWRELNWTEEGTELDRGVGQTDLIVLIV